MLHGLEDACQRQMCRLFNLKNNIRKNDVKEMDILVGVTGETEKSLQFNDFFTQVLYLLSQKDPITLHPMELWNVILPRSCQLPNLTIQQMNPQSISEINTEQQGGLVPCAWASQ